MDWRVTLINHGLRSSHILAHQVQGSGSRFENLGRNMEKGQIHQEVISVSLYCCLQCRGKTTQNKIFLKLGRILVMIESGLQYFWFENAIL